MKPKSPKDRLIDLLKRSTTQKREDVKLSSGRIADVYLDIPGVLSNGENLNLAVSALFVHTEKVFGAGTMNTITAIGGPSFGADALVHGMSMYNHDWSWFTVRDRVKDHGLRSWFVGAPPTKNDRVIMFDDVASTGNSLNVATIRVLETGANVVGIVPLIDRGDKAHELFGINYQPLLSYRDLGISALL